MTNSASSMSGIGFAMGSATLFGASTPLAKLLLGGISPWLMAGLLYLGAGIGLAAARLLSRWRGKPGSEAPLKAADLGWLAARSEEHTSELQSLMRTSSAVLCLKKQKKKTT